MFKDNIRLFTLITNTLAKDKEISDRWRGFKDVADSRHLANRVEPEVVEALVAVRARRLSAHRASLLRHEGQVARQAEARLLGPQRAAARQARARRALGGGAGHGARRLRRLRARAWPSIAKRFFDGAWIDAPVREGKSPGAFSHPTVPSAHPYILMNYQGKPRDVMTLAHELGHGVHQVLAAPLGPLLAPTPLTLAETASVFGEMLTFKALLATATDAKERKALLAQKVEDMINTVVRQIAFYAFERRVHEERKAGELTSERLGQIWLEVQGESLGPAIELDDGYETYWSYVPHFIHSPFYVYAYAFGDCLVNSLYGLYQEAHPGFVGQILRHAGGRRLQAPFRAARALRPRCLASAPSGRRGSKVIEGMIDELEAMEPAPCAPHACRRGAPRAGQHDERCSVQLSVRVRIGALPARRADPCCR